MLLKGMCIKNALAAYIFELDCHLFENFTFKNIKRFRYNHMCTSTNLFEEISSFVENQLFRDLRST